MKSVSIVFSPIVENFLPAGAEAYKEDIPDATVKFYDTGHFALETHVREIGNDILNFMETLPH